MSRSSVMPGTSVRAPRRGVAWYGYMGAPIAWLLHLLGAYAIAEFGCVGLGDAARYMGIAVVSWLLLGLTVLMVLAAGGALVVAGLSRRRLGESSGVAETESFLMRSGAYLGVIFLLIILVQAIPIFYHLEGC
jgi:preprotein translocase subunit SecG